MAYKGKFRPKQPSKYVGDFTNIVYRSLLERKFMVFLDSCDNVVGWNSECVVIPYYFSVTKRRHNYFLDFWVKLSSGEQYIIEIKPYIQTQPPKPSKTQNQKSRNRFIKEQVTFIRNQQKWEAAFRWSVANNINFKVLTDKDLKTLRMDHKLIMEEIHKDNLKNYLIL